MSGIYKVIEGEFGRVVVMEVCGALIAHAHSEIEIGYWLGGGEGNAKINGKIVEYRENTAVAINRYQSHTFEISNKSEVVLVMFMYINEEWFDMSCHHKGNYILITAPQMYITNEVRIRCWDLAQKIFSTNIISEREIKNDVILIIKKTFDLNGSNIAIIPNISGKRPMDYRLRNALRHMQENITQIDLMRNLSKSVGVSRSRLFEIFQKKMSSSPQQVRNSMYLDFIAEDIINSGDNLSTLARRFGFSTAANFSRFFRSHKGITPSTYRKIMRSHLNSILLNKIK